MSCAQLHYSSFSALFHLEPHHHLIPQTDCPASGILSSYTLPLPHCPGSLITVVLQRLAGFFLLHFIPQILLLLLIFSALHHDEFCKSGNHVDRHKILIKSARVAAHRPHSTSEPRAVLLLLLPNWVHSNIPAWRATLKNLDSWVMKNYGLKRWLSS